MSNKMHATTLLKQAERIAELEAEVRQAEAHIEEWRATTKAIADERDELARLLAQSWDVYYADKPWVMEILKRAEREKP